MRLRPRLPPNFPAARTVRSTVAIIVGTALLAALPGSPVEARQAGSRGQLTSVPGGRPDSREFGHVLIKVRPGVSAHQLSSEAKPVLDRWIKVPVQAGEQPEQALQRLLARPEVEDAQLDYIVTLDQGAGVPLAFPADDPNDPGYPYQWHFPGADVPEAWKLSSGSGVTVAVIDTGISRAGEDLTCRELVHEFDAVTQTAGAGVAEDSNGHGTHVAGTIAQCTNNGKGVAGIAHQARLMPINVFVGNSTTASLLASGIDWATTHGARVINLSVGISCAAPWPECSWPIVNDALEAAAEADIVIVAASGNDGGAVVAHPANHPEVIAVGALEARLRRSWYSTYGSALSLSAPGGETSDQDGNLVDRNGDDYPDGILQETLGGMCRAPTTTAYCFMAGTSMASPHVAGSAALLRSYEPGADRNRIRAALTCTALDGGEPGWDPVYGAGALQAGAALKAIRADSCVPQWPAGSQLLQLDAFERSLTVEWSPAIDEVAVTAYRIFVDGNPLATLDGSITLATVGGLTPSFMYTLRVEAGDDKGQWSANGPEATFFTAPDFLDTNGIFFEEDIAWLAGAGITKGCGPQIYCPTDPVTRAQMATFLVRALQLPLVAEDFFSDDNGHPLEAEINALAAARITNGCAEGRFCPDDGVTRAQMAALLVRAFGFPLVVDDYFWDDNGDLLEAEINALAGSGVTRGCGPAIYCPYDAVTREQMAAFIRRAFGR